MGRGESVYSAGPAAEEAGFGRMKNLGAGELLEWGRSLKEGNRNLLPVRDAVGRPAAVSMVVMSGPSNEQKESATPARRGPGLAQLLMPCPLAHLGSLTS